MYDCNKKPILTFIMSYRSGGVRTVYDMFDSVIENIPKEDLKKMEFLVKIDSDDKPVDFSKYPLDIRVFTTNRWEGYRTIYLFDMFLFSQRNPSSRFISHLCDDAIFTKDSKTFIKDLENNKKSYAIINAFDIPHTIEKLEQAKDYRTGLLWTTGFLTEPFPILTCNIVEICGNFGYQPSSDSWNSLLNIILYHKYGIALTTTFPYRHIDRIDNAFKSYNSFKSDFNEEMRITDSKQSSNPYYYDLVEKQVDSIYLHMKNDKFIK